MEVKYDTETIRLITLFENITGAPVKDCLLDEVSNTAYFIVGEGKVGIAIGKNGATVKRVENLIKRTVKVYEFSEDITTFIKGLIPQAIEIKIRNKDEKIEIEIKVGKNHRAIVIGRDGKNLKLYKEIVQRNHKIDDLIIR